MWTFHPRRRGAFGYHPKMGCYPGLSNHLLGLRTMKRRVLIVFCLSAVVALSLIAILEHIGWLLRPRYEGRTISQWLKVLALDSNKPGSPLDISLVHVDTNQRITYLEVPLSY